MKDEIEAAIKALSKKASDAEKASDAMQFAQSSLNLAHALAMLENLKVKP